MEMKKALWRTIRGAGKIYASSLNKYYNKINRDKARLLIYTDSRGFDVVGRYGKTAIGSYINHLNKNYHVDYRICPEKYTTIVDFLNSINKKSESNYDYIVLHCGIVDFSPRPLSNINVFKESKKGNKKFDYVFNKNKEYYLHPWDCLYNSEKTINIYSSEFLQNEIIPELEEIKNLVWVNSNNFVPNWDGNYTKGRPSNISEVVNRFESIMNSRIKNIVNVKQWSNDEVKKFTIDNIHLNTNGFAKVSGIINENIIELSK